MELVSSAVFWDNYVRIDLRIDISFSIRPMTTKFGKPVHLEELNQIRLINQVLVMSSDIISSNSASMATILDWMITYLIGLPVIKSHDNLITCYCETTWETKIIIWVAAYRATWKNKNNALWKNFLYFLKKKFFLYFRKWNIFLKCLMF